MKLNFKVALLIPTLNAGKEWLNTLDSIKSQVFEIGTKIIIDSGSSDDTVSLARQFGFEVVEIKKTEFNHGKTRQQVADLSNGADICIFLTQDAILASTNSIANLVAAFNDSDVGMAYGRQLPHKNAKPLETHARLFNYTDQSEVNSLLDADKLGFKITFCSNSFAAYRYTALAKVGGFPTDSIMGEDAIVAAKMLQVGYKKAYVADATVYHSHSYTVVEEFKRYFDTRVFHEQNKWIIQTYGKPTGAGIKFMVSELKYVLKHDPKSIVKSISSLGAKWLGYKSGGFYKKMSRSLLKKLSMHHFYWK
jgi:rhamnosyltransferase